MESVNAVVEYFAREIESVAQAFLVAGVILGVVIVVVAFFLARRLASRDFDAAVRASAHADSGRVER